MCVVGLAFFSFAARQRVGIEIGNWRLDVAFAVVYALVVGLSCGASGVLCGR